MTGAQREETASFRRRIAAVKFRSRRVATACLRRCGVSAYLYGCSRTPGEWHPGQAP